VPGGGPTFFKSQLHNPISDNVNIVPDDTDNDSTARHDRPQLAMLDDRLVAIACPIASMQRLALGLVRSMDAMRRARDSANRPRRTHRTPLAPGSNKTCYLHFPLALALRQKCLAAPRDVPRGVSPGPDPVGIEIVLGGVSPKPPHGRLAMCEVRF
jgi:hypothetical protein